MFIDIRIGSRFSFAIWESKSYTSYSRRGYSGRTILVVLYGVTLFPLTEQLRAADPDILTPFHADNTEFDGSVRRSSQLLKLIMDRGADWGYLPNPAKSLFILDSPDQEEVEKWKFKAELLHLNFVGGSRYLGAYLRTREQLEACVKPKVEAWYHGVHILDM